MTEMQQILARLESIEAKLERLAGTPADSALCIHEQVIGVDAEVALAAIQGKSLREYLKERSKTPRRAKHKVAA